MYKQRITGRWNSFFRVVRAGLMEEVTFGLLRKHFMTSNGTQSSFPMVAREFEALRPEAGAKA